MSKHIMIIQSFSWLHQKFRLQVIGRGWLSLVQQGTWTTAQQSSKHGCISFPLKELILFYVFKFCFVSVCQLISIDCLQLRDPDWYRNSHFQMGGFKRQTITYGSQKVLGHLKPLYWACKEGSLLYNRARKNWTVACKSWALDLTYFRSLQL